jgi:peptidoglycan/LPS O-acetylase OafA/YrhL
MEFRKDINGLRAIAVLAVVLYHYGVPYFAGGFVGVDVFFVISGFLLTSIAHRRLQEDSFSAAQFLLNRLRRIFPALAILAIACVVWASFFYLPEDYSRLVRNATAALLFRSNYSFLDDAGGYFAPDSRLNILLHTWSLAVESQFYVGFALLCRFFWPPSGRATKRGWALFALFGVASITWSLFHTPVNQPSAFYLLWSRAWEFMVGSVAAIGLARPSKMTYDALAVVGSAFLLFGIFAYDASEPYPGWRAVAPVLGAALLIYAREGFVATLLSTRPLQFVGDISYSVYLWHWPILLAFRERVGTDPSPLQMALLIAASIGAAWLSYLFVEQPTRRVARGRTLAALAVATIAAGFAFSAVLRETDGLPGRLPDYLKSAANAMKEANPRSRECMRDVDGTKRSAGDFCSLGKESVNAEPTIMLWGDSFADMMQPAVDSAAENLHIHGIVATQGGCPPFKGRVFAGSGAEVFSGCERYANFVFDYFARTPSIRLVVIAGDWQRYEPHYEGGVLKQIAEILARRGGQMVFVSAVPNPYSDLPRLWARTQFQAGHAIAEMTVDRPRKGAIIERGMQIAAIARQAGNVSVVDPFKTLCDAKACFIVKNGRALFKDTDHLSQDGVGLIAPELESAITQTYAALIQER